MLTYSNMFEAELRKMMAVRIVDLTQSLAVPGNVANWDEYNDRVGVIAGLREALELCDAASEVCARQQ